MRRAPAKNEQVKPARSARSNTLRTLDRVLSKAGVGSRTQSAEWIRAGRVKVDGKPVTDPERWIDPDRVRVTFDGKLLGAPVPIYMVVSKPKGVITSRGKDVRGRRTVFDLLPETDSFVFPVGRLDLDSSGLLLMTNDSQFAEAMTNPAFKVPKTYLVKASTRLSDEQLDALRSGVVLDDGPTRPATRVHRIREPGGKTVFEITITEGRNRQVRRMVEAVGSKVLKLVRVAIGPLHLGDMPPGKCRELTRQEVRALLALAKGEGVRATSRAESEDGTSRPSRSEAGGKPTAYTTFALTHRVIERGVIRLGYSLEGEGGKLALEETLTLPPGLAGDPSSSAALRALEGLHLACATSYWKAFAPPRVRIEGSPLPAVEAAFWTDAWTHGLGEFFFRNGLSPRGRVAIPDGGPKRAPVQPSVPCDGPPLLLVGGGKDSVVSAEILREAGVQPRLFCLGRSPWIERAASAMGGELLVMERRLAPQLFELNAAGALNGHVPISAIISFAARITALLCGASAVIASNERSASTGNAVVDGIEVNHQWSKGIAYERMVRAWEDRNTPAGPRYFSLLRPLSELAIGRELARHPKYFDVITSCNRNFALRSKPDVPRWCGTCPKCVFVFLMAAPWLDDDGIARLFGRSFIDDPATLPVIEELAGLSGMKPFECVGTPDEVVAAMCLLHDQGRFADSPVMTLFRERILPGVADPTALVADVLRPSDEHAIASPWLEILDAHVRSR